MKASLLALAVTVALFQLIPPPPPPPPPPPGVQRGQAPAPAAAAPVTLDAAQCKCSIDVTVKRSTGEPIADVEVSLTGSNSALPVAALLAATSAAGGNISGALIDSLINSSVRAGGTANTPVLVTTDAGGHAVFRDLAEGAYAIQAKHDGYFGIANDSYPTQAIASVAVGPDNPAGARGAARQRAQQVTLNMVQGVTISGSIFDANRRPASAVQVGAYRVAYQEGHRVLSQTGTTVQSDDRGEYRLFWFPPGEYYIRTGGSGTTAALRAASGNGGNNSQAPSYYPGTADPKTAIPVVVREGSDLTGINIALQASSGVTVSGTIINTIPEAPAGPQGRVNRSVSSVFLVPRNPYFWESPAIIPNISGAARAARGGTPGNDSETPFEIRGLAPGTYDFYPVFNSGAGGTDFAIRLTSYYSARTTIEVGSENITGIQSVIRPGADLKVHLTISGNPPAAAPNRPAQPLTLANIRIRIQPKDNIPSLARSGLTANPTLDADGNFTLANLIDGQYYLSNVNLPADAYVSDIRQDARSVFDDGVIAISKEPSTLEVTVSRGGGTIQGIVQDGKHNPTASARITLIPDMPRRENLILYKTATSNAMGSFNINGIAPGNYKLFAWEQNPAGGEQNAEFMRDYDALGVSVVVAAGLPLANMQVPLIPAKR